MEEQVGFKSMKDSCGGRGRSRRRARDEQSASFVFLFVFLSGPLEGHGEAELKEVCSSSGQAKTTRSACIFIKRRPLAEEKKQTYLTH